MKPLAVLMVLLPFVVASQITTTKEKIKSILETKEKEIPVYKFKNHTTCMTIQMDFGKSKSEYHFIDSLLDDCEIINIDLVYTDYPKEEDFYKLNYKRLKYLNKLLPSAFKSNINWYVYKQTSCKTEDEARNLFHGLAIYYKSSPKRELKLLDRMLNNPELITDSVVLNSFERNQNWKNVLLVADLTGSMAQYTSQTLKLIKENTKNIKHLIFFNDGDMKPDYAKKIGNTGGIYSKKNIGIYDTILKLAGLTMSNGCGGDAPENNMEALFQGIKDCPNCKDIVLIADNLANMRDVSMIESFKRPVHIILGNVYYSFKNKSGGISISMWVSNKINPQYLRLAQKTKGSLHLLNEDIIHIPSKNGEKMTINGLTYVYLDGAFVEVKKM
jgi:hypothetical protein